VIEWFRRLGDIPGVTFASAPGVDARALPGYGTVPEIHVRNDLQGRAYESLWWPSSGVYRGGTGSPAYRWIPPDFRGVSIADVLKKCFEGLELPGPPGDYLRIIERCAGAHWNRWPRQLGVSEQVEKLCFLGLQLIDACPDALTDRWHEQPRHSYTFTMLIDLYEREGFLLEALDVAEHAARYGGGLEVHERLAERIASIEHEDRG
jgi:hypothetical protein